MVRLEGGAKLGELVAHLAGDLLVAFGRWGDAERLEQLRGRCSRVSGFTEYRVKALVGQMTEDEVDDAPGVVGLLCAVRRAVHEPSTRSWDCIRHLKLRQCEEAVGLCFVQ